MDLGQHLPLTTSIELCAVFSGCAIGNWVDLGALIDGQLTISEFRSYGDLMVGGNFAWSRLAAGDLHGD